MRNLKMMLVAGVMAQKMPVLGSDMLHLLAQTASVCPVVETTPVEKRKVGSIDWFKETDESEILEVLRRVPADQIDQGLVYECHGNFFNILHIAAQVRKLEVVKLLVQEKGVDLNSRDSYDRTVLHYAAAAGELNVVKFLVEKGGMNLTWTDKAGRKVLTYAAEYRAQNVVDYIQERLSFGVSASSSLSKLSTSNVSSSHSAVKDGGFPRSVPSKDVFGEAMLELDFEGKSSLFSLIVGLANNEEAKGHLAKVLDNLLNRPKKRTIQQIGADKLPEDSSKDRRLGA